MILTELEMSDKFELLLSRNVSNELPEFEALFREVTCKQGIPDLIGISKIKNNSDWLFNPPKDINVEASSLILSLLKKKSPRRLKYLEDKTGYTPKYLCRALIVLLREGYVIQTEYGSYLLSETSINEPPELWAFELKLKNWKRAMFQALQYKAFANKVAVVFPLDRKNIMLKNLDSFKSVNVGVYIFDSEKMIIETLYKPRKGLPQSKQHSIYALGKISGVEPS